MKVEFRNANKISFDQVIWWCWIQFTIHSPRFHLERIKNEIKYLIISSLDLIWVFVSQSGWNRTIVNTKPKNLPIELTGFLWFIFHVFVALLMFIVLFNISLLNFNINFMKINKVITVFSKEIWIKSPLFLLICLWNISVGLPYTVLHHSAL